MISNGRNIFGDRLNVECHAVDSRVCGFMRWSNYTANRVVTICDSHHIAVQMNLLFNAEEERKLIARLESCVQVISFLSRLAKK